MRFAALRTVAAAAAFALAFALTPTARADLKKLEAEFKAAADKIETAAVIVVASEGADNRFVPRVSGVLVSKTGLVLTHSEAGISIEMRRGQAPKIGHSDDVDVRVPDLKKGTFTNYRGKVLRRFEDQKTALVKVLEPPKGMGFPTYLVPAESGDLRPGQFLFAMGNSGQSSDEALPSLMAGVVASAPRRTGSTDQGPLEAIYTTAAINPGMAGGPVVDVHGRLVGTIDTWVDATRESTSPYQFLGRVIPMDRLRAVYGGLQETAAAFTAVPPKGLVAEDATALESVFARAAESARPAVVSLEVKRKSPVSSTTLGRDGRATDLPRYRGPISGFAASADGLIVTALYDVTNLATLIRAEFAGAIPKEATTKAGIDAIEGATVHLPGGGSAEAKLLAVHEGLGIALFRAQLPDGTKLPTLEISPESELAEGRFVVAVGNPFGAAQLPEAFLTTGILSKRHADDAAEAWRGHWQTDARSTDGNCGGAVVDLRGRLIGMLSLWDPAMHGRASGIGFVLPWSKIAAALPALSEGKSWRRPFLGVRWDTDVAGVARIKAIVPDSSAAAAGLQPGDELIEVDGTAVSSPEQCTPLFAKHVAGETIKLKVHRGTEILDIEATLGARD